MAACCLCAGVNDIQAYPSRNLIRATGGEYAPLPTLMPPRNTGMMLSRLVGRPDGRARVLQKSFDAFHRGA